MAEESTRYGPVVVVSRDGTRGIELVEYEGKEKIPNRDARGFYFTVRTDRDGAYSHLSVVFDGMAEHWLKPSVFNLPDKAGAELWFVHFSEAAIGDRLDSPEPLFPSGGLAAPVECFSACQDGWKTRAPADDDAIEAYIRARMFWSWQFGHDSVLFTTPDYLRLGVNQSRFLRVAEFGEPDLWTITWRNPFSITLSATRRLLKEEKEGRRPQPQSQPQPQPQPQAKPFVDEGRLQELRSISSVNFDLRRLVALCEELNVCAAHDCFYATAMLTRAIIDHVPPIFGSKTFNEVANNHGGGGRSFKDHMVHLSNSARKIADSHLHLQVRNKEVLANRTQVDFARDLDVLLAEVVRHLS